MKNQKMKKQTKNNNAAKTAFPPAAMLGLGIIDVNLDTPESRWAVELWWKGAPSDEKLLAYQVALMLEDVEFNVRLEIRREGTTIKKRFIEALDRPEAGCQLALVVPKVGGAGLN